MPGHAALVALANGSRAFAVICAGRVVLVPDNDEPGWKHVHQVGAALAGIAARIRVLALPGLRPKGDVMDWLRSGGTREQLDVLIEPAPDWRRRRRKRRPTDENKAKAAADEQKLIDELARLNAIEYDRRRNEAADQMGIRRGTLDDQVKRAAPNGPKKKGRRRSSVTGSWSRGRRRSTPAS